MAEPISQIMKESFEVDNSFFPERVSARICEQSWIINVAKTSSQDRSLQRTVEQMLDVSVDRVQQQTAKHIVDEVRKKLTAQSGVTGAAGSGSQT